MNHQHLPQRVFFLGLVALFIAGCGGLRVEPPATPTPVPPAPTPMTRLDGQSALFVLPDRFSQVEYRRPRTILEALGATVTIATYSSEAVLGSDGNLVEPDAHLEDVHAGGYDAIVFVGGSGIRTGDPEVQRIVQEALAGDTVVAAICAAQGILTRAGVREGKGTSGPYVERSGRIITASGPIKSREFGEAIAAALGE